MRKSLIHAHMHDNVKAMKNIPQCELQSHVCKRANVCRNATGRKRKTQQYHTECETCLFSIWQHNNNMRMFMFCSGREYMYISSTFHYTASVHTYRCLFMHACMYIWVCVVVMSETTSLNITMLCYLTTVTGYINRNCYCIYPVDKTHSIM